MIDVTRRKFLKRSVASVIIAPWLMSCESYGEVGRVQSAAPFDEFLNVDTLDLANLIKTKQLSQMELLEIVIRRIEAANPTLNFMTNRFYDRAHGRIANMSLDTPFAGVPMLLKDMVDLAGMPRTDGSNFPPINIPAHSGMYVAGLERAGMNFIGMTNVPEYAGVGGTDNDRFGATRNPWNLAYYPAFSSGGSAAAVAAGVLPMAHGTDGAGSNRLTASVTGLLGMKATRYRMLADTHSGQHDIAKTNQMISRSVRDSAQAFHLTQDPKNGLYPTEKLIVSPNSKRLKIGFVRDSSGLVETSAEILMATENSARLLENLGHTVVETSYPVSAEMYFKHYLNFFAGKTAGLKDVIEAFAGKPLLESGLLTTFLAGSLIANESVTSEEVLSARAYFDTLPALFDKKFERFDLLLTPVAPLAGVRIDESGADKEFNQASARSLIGFLKFTGPVNFAGCPAMSAPFTWQSEAGLPIGMHLIAARGNDRMLYELGYELEEAQPWKNRWAPHSLMYT